MIGPITVSPPAGALAGPQGGPAMPTPANIQPTRRVALAAALSLFAALLLVSTALAGFYNISVSDNSVADWAGVSVLHDDGVDSEIDPQYDILQTYMARDAALTALFFRITMAAEGLGESLVVASLDCNNNGSYFDGADIYVLYDPADAVTGFVEVGNGNGTSFVDLPDSGQVVVNGTDVDYEWRGTVTGTPLESSPCRNAGTINVIMEASGEFTDLTDPAPWNVPTAVELQTLAARPQVAPLAVAALFGLAGLLVAGALFALRRARG